jgi:flagellar hook assembly protein FlgD
LANGWVKIDSVSGGATTFTDNTPPFGLVYYFVEIVPPNPCNITKAKTNYNHSRSNRTSTIQFVGMEEVTNQDLTLKVYPNPYSGKTNIVYELLEHSEVTIEIYSSMGQKVADIHQGTQSQGIYRYQFNAEDYGFGAGVYYLRMKVGNQMISRKLVQVK